MCYLIASFAFHLRWFIEYSSFFHNLLWDLSGFSFEFLSCTFQVPLLAHAQVGRVRMAGRVQKQALGIPVAVLVDTPEQPVKVCMQQ